VDPRTGKALGVAVWDVDGDGWPDILVANDVTPNYLFRNNRDGTFTDIAAESGTAFGEDGTARSGMGIDVSEYLNDGRPAVFISNFSREPNSFFVRERPGLFTDRTYAAGLGESSLLRLGFGLFFFDYDNDGWRDAFVTNGHIEPRIERFESPITHAQPPLLYRNTRDGRFADVSRAAGDALPRPRVGRGAAYGDYDNDGDLDLLLSNNDGPAELLRNDGGNRRHWLRIRLVGRRSNRDGVGARVRVVSGGVTQRDQLRSGSSYLSHSADRLHFGLGAASVADLIEIAWPSGVVDRVRDVETDRTLVIEEGRGVVHRR
jgi:hypothetical protein